MKTILLKISLIAFLFSLTTQNLSVQAQGKQKKTDKKESDSDKKDPWKSETFGGLMFRNIGPAKTEGRVVDFAVNPNNHKEYFVAAASGGVWKTTNAGISYTPVFDGQGSYSIGCV